jgi:hypothetical protein
MARLVTAEQTARESYENVLANYASSQISASTDTGTSGNFVIVDEPLVPGAPIPPPRRDLVLNPMLGLTAGLVLSTAIFILLWRLDRVVRLPSDLAIFGPDVPIMSIPRLHARGRRWPASFVRLATALQSGFRAGPESREATLAPRPAPND